MGKRWTIVIGVAAAGVMALGAQMASATFPGQDGRISFARVVPKTDSIEIFTARPDGSDAQRLTSNPRRVSFVPDWSPDGEMIAFDSDRVDVDGPRGGPDVRDERGWERRHAAHKGRGFHGGPAWSPDGGRLAIETEWGDYPARAGIWIIPASDPDGVTQEEAQRVTTVPAGFEFDGEAQFSPDGSSIVFTRFKSFEREVGDPPGERSTGPASSASPRGSSTLPTPTGRPTGR